VPHHFVWADDARVHAFMRHSDPQNFGHLMVDDLLSAFTAGSPSLFTRGPSARAHPSLARAFRPDLGANDLRLILMEWCPCCRANFGINLISNACSRYKTHGGWLQGLTVLDSQELSSYVALQSCM
jgi:hypothetical protein